MEYLFRTERAATVKRLARDSDTDLHIPFLCDVEVASAMRRLLREERTDLARAVEALEDLLHLPLIRHQHAHFLHRALALRDNFTAYDAMYVALAEALGATLLTADARLVRSVRRHTDLEVVSAAA